MNPFPHTKSPAIQGSRLSRAKLFGLALAFVCSATPALAQAAASHDASASRHEIVFVESNVADYKTLLDGVKPGEEVHVLDATRDGLAQMAEILAGKHGVEAIHIVSHGSEGAVQLGALDLTKRNLNGHVTDLAAISKALKPGGDLLLYGCNVAAGREGSSFVSALAQKTKAVVAASTDLTGAA
ncbi:MAG: DUF4347 domain-containing protein, partial [Sulfuricellaceae bacterium]|nr:DUF4347 domain-containing protein [Sulfuricellaceae bacterium]